MSVHRFPGVVENRRRWASAARLRPRAIPPRVAAFSDWREPVFDALASAAVVTGFCISAAAALLAALQFGTGGALLAAAAGLGGACAGSAIAGLLFAKGERA